jgi:hypothetical protein
MGMVKEEEDEPSSRQGRQVRIVEQMPMYNSLNFTYSAGWAALAVKTGPEITANLTVIHVFLCPSEGERNTYHGTWNAVSLVTRFAAWPTTRPLLISLSHPSGHTTHVDA